MNIEDMLNPSSSPITETVSLGSFNAKIHFAKSNVIILNYPGISGDIDGYNNKYGKLADFLVEKNVGAVVRMGNQDYGNYPINMIENFRKLIDGVLKNSQNICGTSSPEIYLMGFSAGASTIAAIAADYDQVKKILLVAPSGDSGRIQELKRFKGEVYITIGANDEIVGAQAGQFFYDLATNALRRKLEIISNCDHQFRGRVNGMIMSKAPLWAFAGDTTFPSPEGGKELY